MHSSSEPTSRSATPDLRVCTREPPSSSCVTSSPVTAFTRYGPASAIEPRPFTIGTKSARPGMYAVPAAPPLPGRAAARGAPPPPPAGRGEGGRPCPPAPENRPSADRRGGPPAWGELLRGLLLRVFPPPAAGGVLGPPLFEILDQRPK